MEIVQVPLSVLRAHPMNSNVMPEGRVAKLAGHIGRTGQYPPLIVRRVRSSECGVRNGEEEADSALDTPRSALFEVLDGHHRWKALERLGQADAAAVVWEVDDEQALVLLATLNRLQGADDPRKRAAILEQLAGANEGRLADLAKLLPETAEQVRKFLEVRRRLPRPIEPRGLEEMPTVMNFFLTGREREEVEARLDEIGGRREEALMRLVRGEEER